MRSSDLAKKLLEINDDISEVIDAAKQVFASNFVHVSPTASNEKQAIAADFNKYCVDYLIASQQSAYWKKEYDKAKINLDSTVDDPIGVAGQVRELRSDNDFVFKKRQNNDGETTLVVDLVTALARAGVEKSVVDAALKQATKAKKGSTYYIVETN